MLERLKRWHWFTRAQLGIDILALLRSMKALPWFFASARKYREMGGHYAILVPCLHDRGEQSGNARGEYFWQDLFVARAIHGRNPVRHVDVGSRVDGFVAHVASFREIEVLDVRPLRTLDPRIKFRQADLTNADGLSAFAADSVSCLHALEHFGLGRYGDSLSPTGHLEGVRNLGRLVADGGVLYLSAPVGRPRVLFNANRILDPLELVDAAETAGLVLEGLHCFDSVADRLEEVLPTSAALAAIRAKDYVLAVFIFRRSTSSSGAIGGGAKPG